MPNETSSSSVEESSVSVMNVTEQVEEANVTKQNLKQVDASVGILMDSALLEYDLSKDLYI